MGRPARFDAETLLDAAVEIAAESGPAAVTMAAVARRAGAPSGSVYHRFPDRAALTAALWLRTVERFHAGLLEEMTREPAVGAAVGAAQYVVAWSRAHTPEARVLLAGADAFGQDDWAEPARDSAAARQAGLESALRRLACRLDLRTAEQIERLVLVVVDLPYAVVRRHLSTGRPLSPTAAETVAHAARQLLAPVGG